MNRIVILAEKANAAKDIADAMQLGNLRKTDDGFLVGNEPDGSEIVITHSQGHCLRLLEPEEIDEKYKKWNVGTLPIPFDDSSFRAIDAASAKRYKAITDHIRKADLVINAGDAGREGEVIQRRFIRIAGKDKKVLRLWTSTLTRSGIRAALDNLLGTTEGEQRVLDNLYAAGEARSVMDKYMGYNYSRLISLTQTDGVTVNYGRCKSPLVNAICLRDEEIAAFVKRPYSYVNVFLKKGEDTAKAVVVDDNLKRIELDTKAAAEEYIKGFSGSAKVISQESEKKTEKPPKPFDILSLQKEMAKRYGYDADETLAICQALYDKHKILSYPRSDSRYLTTDLKDSAADILKSLNFGEYAGFVEMAMPHKIPDRYFNDSKVADHHALIPIVPDGSMQQKYLALTEKEKNVFDSVVRSFIALFLPNHEYMQHKAVLKDGSCTLLYRGRAGLNAGFKAVLLKDVKEKDSQEDLEDESTVTFSEGESVLEDEVKICETETKPKSHFTTASLLDYMKIHNIGTGATRDSIIKELTEKKGFNRDASVKRDGKYFIATDFGKEMNKLIPESLKSIEFLSDTDAKLEAIAKGSLSKEDFLLEIQDKFMESYADLVKNQKHELKSSPKSVESSFICPVCNVPLLDKDWGYACRNWTKDGSGCNYSLSKKIAGKKLSDKVLRELIATGATRDKVKGFKSKAGKSFDAKLRYEYKDGSSKISFDFD